MNQGPTTAPGCPSASPQSRVPMSRLRYAALAVLTIAAGLALVRLRGALPAAATDVLGDALWAAMMFWWVSALLPAARPGARAAAALGVAWVVEASQLARP